MADSASNPIEQHFERNLRSLQKNLDILNDPAYQLYKNDIAPGSYDATKHLAELQAAQHAVNDCKSTLETAQSMHRAQNLQKSIKTIQTTLARLVLEGRSKDKAYDFYSKQLAQLQKEFAAESLKTSK